jgi:outer membrane protein
MGFFAASCVMHLMRLLLFLLPLAVATATIVRADEPAPLTLEHAFASVEHVNLNVFLSREAAVQAAEAAYRQRAGILPQIALDAQQQRELTVSSQNGGLTQTGPYNRFDGQITASYDLLDAAQIETYRSAHTGAQGAQLDYQATLQQVFATVAQAYFTHLRNLHQIDVLDSNIARAKSLLDLAETQLHAGVATQIDVTRAEAELATDEQARLQQDTVVYQSELQLQRLLDLDLSKPLKLDDFPVQHVDAEPLDAGTEHRAFALRSDYLSAKSQVRQNQQSVLAARFESLPVLSLFGDYGYANQRAFDGGDHEEWLAGVEFNLPIFDGLRARSDRHTALSRLRAQERSLHDLETQISSEVRLAIQDAHSRFAQIAVAEKSRQLADQQLQLASLRFKQGVADNQEVIDAQNGLVVAEDNLNDAIYLYNLSRVELARAKGEVRNILQERAP